MSDVRITFERVAEDVPAPVRATAGAAGYDVCAYFHTGQPTRELFPGERVLVPTGLKFCIPPGWEIQVRPRSGLALKHGLTVLNTPGTIDSDYRGELGVILMNSGGSPFSINHGDRIAQLVVAPTHTANFVGGVVHNDTGRSAGGFGSTGV